MNRTTLQLLLTGLVIFLIVAGGVYVRYNSEEKPLQTMGLHEKSMYYRKQADALFDTLYEYELRSQPAPTDKQQRYDDLEDSADKYLIEYRNLFSQQ